MIAIGESIHVISPAVRQAIETRDSGFLQGLAVRQVKGGADLLDLNIGPQKKAGAEVMDWAVNTIQAVVDLPLSLDTTNALAIEAGLKRTKRPAIINSTDATERMEVLMPMASKYGSSIVALTYGGTALPTNAGERVQLAAERILPAAARYGIPMERLLLDPLVLTVNGNQDQTPQTLEAVRMFKQLGDPPPMTVCGLSNVSNGCPAPIRKMLNEVFLIMMLGAGLDMAIVDVFDEELMGIPRVLQSRDESTAVHRAYLCIYDAYRAGEELDRARLERQDKHVDDVVKTLDILENKTLYAHSYLKL